ncbi:tyrosine--tRNA ligase [Helicobacter sp. MIT 21-1697]|uniref:tyrosine--tRNA ligase n=1 Tax=Helicobacter sp. MIT 21-1697 TaxID=2993733 RepID=UPI00224BA0C6|nr:tyrosine--tRNA ligase [Helicobacter sp. MIT 21-1697]MCX2716973.1 tyrosine--tRNA ligase [Helicobacter sp. MIT 21-1697]
MKIKQAMQELKRGCVEFIGEEYIRDLVERFYNTGERFCVKAGFDPTAPDLHLGHTVLLQKLATFQRYGGNVKFLIGDFTATIGDPSGKSETRKPLSREQVEANALTYKEQVFKVLDPQYTQICFNSKWLNELGALGLITLTSHFSVARMLERDDFTKRYSNNQSISIVEFIYPLLQGYDSVALNCDIELGGNDQKFNLLVGRSLQRAYKLNKEQSVMTMPLLEGLDGVQKMSKSLNNYIGVTESANTMYAKILSISDEMMWRYYELLSSLSLQEIFALKEQVNAGNAHPKVVKEQLALEITTRYHNIDLAKQAKIAFDNVFSKDEIPTDLAVFTCNEGEWIAKVLVIARLCESTSQARRDIRAGALKINKEKITNEELKLSKGEYIVQIGKRRFAKVIIS